MFSLIITIISIALVAALTVATVFYGGAAFTQNSAKTIADKLINDTHQLISANTLYANDNGGTFATSPSTLSPNYLSTVPIPPPAGSPVTSYAFSGNAVILMLNPDTTGAANGGTLCSAINAAAGNTAGAATVPSYALGDFSYLNGPYIFGCVQINSSTVRDFWSKG